MPNDYIRKQTLVNAERFITPELKEYEEKVLSAEERIIELEYSLFEEIRKKVASFTEEVLRTAGFVAELDAILSLTEVARRNNYSRPVVNDEEVIRITEGRHPVLELIESDERFVPNDTLIDCDENQILIITGPNMAGKSTYMRQIALIVIMAQMGGFVPAKEAVIGTTDRIFTRVGASDVITKGKSTFMVEMTETANILNNATRKSLILLDEIGRGTSTFDGISIAWATAEFIHRNIKAKTLFATHYHELTELSLLFDGIKNYNALVREWNDEIIFIRRIVGGISDKSYGIQVARLAGLPHSVIVRAKEILENLEKGEFDESGEPRIGHSEDIKREEHPPQLSLFGDKTDLVAKEILNLNIQNMTPLEALNKLNDFKKMLGG